jgi:uncharacterized phage-associated protein
MRTRFREDKTTQAAARLLQLCGGRMAYLKLIKLLYLTDREALIRWGRPITYDTYVAMKHGPVLGGTLDMIKGRVRSEGENGWHRHIERVGEYDVQLRGDAQPGTDLLSPADAGLLEEIAGKYGRYGKWELVRLVHALPECVDPETMNQRAFPIDPRDILRAAGYGEDDITAIQEEIEAVAYADRVLE